MLAIPMNSSSRKSCGEEKKVRITWQCFSCKTASPGLCQFALSSWDWTPRQSYFTKHTDFQAAIAADSTRRIFLSSNPSTMTSTTFSKHPPILYCYDAVYIHTRKQTRGLQNRDTAPRHYTQAWDLDSMFLGFNAPPNGRRNRSGLGTKHAFTSLDLLMDRVMTVACELKVRDEKT